MLRLLLEEDMVLLQKNGNLLFTKKNRFTNLQYIALNYYNEIQDKTCYIQNNALYNYFAIIIFNILDKIILKS